MLPLGHTGIVLGIGAALTPLRATGQTNGNWFLRLAEAVDIRILMVGALLPDIIDKPLGHYIFPEALGNGRIYAHTLLFSLLLLAGGWLLYRYRRRMWLLLLGAGSFLHILLDQMWTAPKAFFWPLFGFSFDKYVYDNYLGSMWEALFSNPGAYIPEIIGGLIVIWFGIVLLRRRKLLAFIIRGKLSA